MSTFDAGFAAGERQAFKDRCSKVSSVCGHPAQDLLTSQYQRGFVAGYTPRSATWSRPVEPVAPWWAERESVVA